MQTESASAAIWQARACASVLPMRLSDRFARRDAGSQSRSEDRKSTRVKRVFGRPDANRIVAELQIVRNISYIRAGQTANKRSGNGSIDVREARITSFRPVRLTNQVEPLAHPPNARNCTERQLLSGGSPSGISNPVTRFRSRLRTAATGRRPIPLMYRFTGNSCSPGVGFRGYLLNAHEGAKPEVKRANASQRLQYFSISGAHWQEGVVDAGLTFNAVQHHRSGDHKGVPV